jgi:hypothetical protein
MHQGQPDRRARHPGQSARHGATAPGAGLRRRRQCGRSRLGGQDLERCSAKIIFVSGSPFDAMKPWQRRFYFDQGGTLTPKFGIRHTPGGGLGRGREPQDQRDPAAVAAAPAPTHWRRQGLMTHPLITFLKTPMAAPRPAPAPYAALVDGALLGARARRAAAAAHSKRCFGPNGARSRLLLCSPRRSTACSTSAPSSARTRPCAGRGP